MTKNPTKIEPTNTETVPPETTEGPKKKASSKAPDEAPPAPETAPAKTTINTRGISDDLIVARVLEVLKPGTIGVFRKNGKVVEVREAGGKPPTTEILVMSRNRLASLLSSRIQWRGVDSVPSRILESILRDHVGSFPELLAVADAPVLLPSGKVALQQGFKASAGVFVPESVADAFKDIALGETQQEAKDALKLINDTFVDFPFADDQSRSASVASLLTQVGRHGIKGQFPLFVVESPQPRTGKGKLVHALSFVARAKPCPMEAWEGASKASVEKARESGVRFLDDVRSAIGPAWLDVALTDPSARTVWICAGNRLTFKPDTQKRAVLCKLDAKMEHPDERTEYEHPDIESYVLERRVELVGAALTILRAFSSAGRPSQGLLPMGGFEDWSNLVRSAIVWAGGADCCEGRSEILVEENGAQDAFADFLKAWRSTFEDEAVTLNDVVERAGLDTGDFAGALEAFCPLKSGQDLLRQLSYAVRSKAGWVAGGLRLAQEGDRSKHGRRWAVRPVGVGGVPIKKASKAKA